MCIKGNRLRDSLLYIMNNDRLKGILYLLITAIIWGGSFISQFFGGAAIGSFSFNGYRCVFGCFTIAIMIFYDSKLRTGKFKFFREDEDIIKTIKDSSWCGITLFCAMIIQQLGVQRTDTAKAGLITSLEVICVPILMLLLYKRKIKFITWVFIVTTMLGIMLLSINSLSGVNSGDILVAISSVLYSITIIQVTKYVNGIDPLKFSFFRFVIVGILGFIGAMILKEDFISTVKLKAALPSIIYSGILGSGVAYTFSIIGQRYCEPIIATLIMSLEGIFAAIFGWIILGQALNLIQILGIIIAFISIVFVQITDYSY